jgi:hypothetical protein
VSDIDARIIVALDTLRAIEKAVYADCEARCENKNPKVLAEIVRWRVDSCARLFAALS